MPRPRNEYCKCGGVAIRESRCETCLKVWEKANYAKRKAQTVAERTGEKPQNAISRRSGGAGRADDASVEENHIPGKPARPRPFEQSIASSRHPMINRIPPPAREWVEKPEFPKPEPELLRRARIERIKRDGPSANDSHEDLVAAGLEVEPARREEREMENYLL